MTFSYHHPNYYKKQKEEARKPLSEVQLQDLKGRGISKKEIDILKTVKAKNFYFVGGEKTKND